MGSVKRTKKLSVAGALACSGLFIAASAQAVNIDKLVVVGGNTSPTVQAASGDVPMGQSAGDKASLLPEDVSASDESLFGGQGGYIHINAMVQGEYTDNVYNTDTNKLSSWITTLSPTLWFTVPRKKDIPVTIAPNNTSAGGLAQAIRDYEGTDRFQAYALGNLDFLMYSENEDLNTINGLAEGMFRYNMPSGLSLMVIDRFTQDSDRFDIGSAQGRFENKFNSNIAVATADWNITEKLRAKFDYSNFFLDYDERIDAFKERSDNSFDLYGYYNYSLKTSFFVEGKFVDVAYDTATVNDNQQFFFYGGIKWDTTEKVSLMAKAGLQEKEFDNSDQAIVKRDDYSDFTFDVQAVYKVTEKTKLTLDMYLANEETDSIVASDKTVLGAKFGYNQKFTDKISGSLFAFYEDAEYDQLVARERDDSTFLIRPAAQYLFKEWLMAELSYQYEQRDSTDDLFDFETNTFMGNVKVAF
jgi:hypothetical protein